MDLALFNLDGFLFFLRWMHFFFGITWIGLLYYFNFVQGAFFAEIDGNTKSVAIQKLVPKALWWFRWGAVWTFATGLLTLAIRGHQFGSEFFNNTWGVMITIGAILGTTMFLNVWLIIWPNQKVVIQSATQAANGGQALPEAAACAAKAGLASRHNVLFSIPMLFFMGAGRHLPITMSETSSVSCLMITFLIILLGLEFNAIKGKLGPITTVKGAITCGFSLAFLLYVIAEVCL